MPVLKTAAALALAVAIAALGGCHYAHPQPTALRVAKPKKATEMAAEQETELDDGVYYAGPDVSRKNLPLAGTTWAWEGVLKDNHLDSPTQTGEYRLVFKPNGWFDFQADCRHGVGMYEANGQRIVLAVIKASHSHCHPGSWADDFIHGLEAAKTFRRAEAKLYFELKRDSKTMVFGLRP